MNLFQTQLFKRFRNRKSTRQLDAYRVEVEQINTIEHLLIGQSDDEIRSAVSAMRRELQAIASPREQLAHMQAIRPQAFALAKNAARRLCGREFEICGQPQVWQMVPYDVQLIGGIALAEGKLAEMHTGEGKTLAATLPGFLHALAGRGVHLITVNDYLARRDASWMGKLFELLGLSVGCLQNGQSPDQRRAAYACDITYGTASEFGFDYLRDQGLATSRDQQVQRGRFFALIDEVDSVLIDEARTPLIIAGPSSVDLASCRIENDNGLGKIPNLRPAVESLVEAQRQQCDQLIRNGSIAQLLKAYCLYERDRDYIVEDGKVVIVDRQQARKMPGRRWGDGLHQAVEAKEGVELEEETETLASVTVQNFFRLYPRLAGMSGTIATEADEFEEIYGLGVVEVPPHRPSQRQDLDDFIFKTRREKFNAIVAEIKEAHARRQPVLLGTASVEESEVLSKSLKRARLPHAVLNAKHHAQEAEIVARAGRAGAITVSTNMAGRGTDIALGEGVAELGGLYVIGSERHESRRVDHQLRGRCARQGDPGRSRFFVSFEDPLMQHFGDTDRIIRLLGKIELDPCNALEHPFLSRSIAAAQKRVEASHFEARKHTLRYDDIVSQQRRAIYDRRQAFITTGDPAAKIGQEENTRIDPDIERAIILGIIDEAWRDHLAGLDEMREGIGLVQHAQKDPLLEFRRCASRQFQEMQKRVEWQLAEDFPRHQRVLLERQRRNDLAEALTIPEIHPPMPEKKVSRNAPCPCGSGRKFKRCCGRVRSGEP